MGTVKAHRPVLAIEEVTLAIACNQCGSAAPFEDHAARANFHLFTAAGGYGTEYPGDVCQVEFALCSTCLKAMVDGFKIEAPVTGGIGGGGPDPLRAFHTEREEEVTIDAGWCYNAENMPAPWTRETDAAYKLLYKEQEAAWQALNEKEWAWPSATLYRHFKGRLYEVLFPNNWMGVFDWETQVPLVIYRALYGESQVFARPLDMWNDEMDQGEGEYKGPRFRPITPADL